MIARGAVPQRVAPALPPIELLTKRETELIAAIADGQSYQNAAETLGISINTVRNHIRSAYQKLRVNTRSEAVSRALRAGLIC